MRRADSLIVPVTFLCALVAVLAVTVSWVGRPTFITMTVSLGPPGIVPGRVYGLSYTPRNAVSGHILTRMDPSQPRCVDVTITDTSLTYLDERKACRTRAGSYRMDYRFPRADDYITFIELHPKGGTAVAYRHTVSLDQCALRRYQREWHGHCAPRVAQLRGKETVRAHTIGGVTVVLGAPAHAVQTGQRVQASFVFLRHGRGVQDLRPLDGAAGQLVAISMDTYHLTRFRPDPGQVVDGRIASSAISFSGWFDHPAIYRLFGAFRYHRHIVRASFVIDVNPKPRPTPSSG